MSIKSNGSTLVRPSLPCRRLKQTVFFQSFQDRQTLPAIGAEDLLDEVPEVVFNCCIRLILTSLYYKNKYGIISIFC